MEEFPSQSHAAREPREIQPVTTSPGRIRKAPFGRRFMETFILGDARTTWTGMLWDTFLPNLRDNFADAFHEGVDIMFNGGSRGPRYHNRRSSRYATGSQISKHNPDRALSARSGQSERYSDEDRNRQNTSVIEWDARVEAEAVLDGMLKILDQYDEVKLAEFYQLADITPQHTDYKWGWEELGNARVVHSRGAYYIDLPPVIPLR